jgi:hypothetical protein
MSRNNKNNKSEFWSSDCFYQKELQRIWALSEPEKGEEGNRRLTTTTEDVMTRLYRLSISKPEYELEFRVTEEENEWVKRRMHGSASTWIWDNKK